jgi:hypothetical protein
MAADHPWLTPAYVLDSPFVLLAYDNEQAVDELIARRARYGFDSVTTHEPNVEVLGEVIAAYRARSAPRQ